MYKEICISALNIFEESLVLVGVEARVDHYKWTACGNIVAVSKHDHIVYQNLFLYSRSSNLQRIGKVMQGQAQKTPLRFADSSERLNGSQWFRSSTLIRSPAPFASS